MRIKSTKNLTFEDVYIAGDYIDMNLSYSQMKQFDKMNFKRFMEFIKMIVNVSPKLFMNTCNTTNVTEQSFLSILGKYFFYINEKKK